MGDGDNEEAARQLISGMLTKGKKRREKTRDILEWLPVGAVRNTGERIVPGQECRKDTESASSLDAAFVGSAAAVLEVANAEEEEGHVEGEEQ